MNAKQPLVATVISASALTAQAAFIADMTADQIRGEIIAAQRAAGRDLAALIASATAAGLNLNSLQAVATAEPAPATVVFLPPPPLATLTTQNACSVSCS